MEIDNAGLYLMYPRPHYTNKMGTQSSDISNVNS